MLNYYLKINMSYKEQKQDKKTYPVWAQGFRVKDAIVKHPYLANDFKFDSQQTKKK